MRYLINRNYTCLWYGQALSGLGDYMFDTTLALWVATKLGKGQPWAPAAMGGVLLAAGIAVLIVGPIAGVFVDRWNRQAVMLRTEVVRAVLVVALACLAFLPQRNLPTAAWLITIYAAVFMVNAAGQFFGPARLAILGSIVPDDLDRARASGIEQSTAAAAAIIGPPLAAPLLFTIGMQWALIFNAASYVVSYVAVRAVRIPPAERQVSHRARTSTFRSEFAEGLRFFFHSRFLVTLLTLAVIAQLGTGALNTLDIFFLTGNLHTSANMYGLLSTAFGVGAVIGGLASGRIVRMTGARAMVWLGTFTAGVVVLIYARQAQFAAALCLVALLALTVTMLNTAIIPLLLKAAPPEVLGRAMAVFMPVNTLSQMLSMAAAGWLASSALRGFHGVVLGVHIGPVDTIFSASGLLMIAAGVFGLLMLPRDTTAGASSESRDQQLVH